MPGDSRWLRMDERCEPAPARGDASWHCLLHFQRNQQDAEKSTEVLDTWGMISVERNSQYSELA
jgi:hypothetical protein